MARDKKHSLKIINTNKHLLDVFSDDLYLELGSIDYDPLNDLLNKKMVEFDKISHLEIINKGLGSMVCDSEELSYKLPFLKLNNIVEKNKSCQLVITYGLLLRRQGYKEHFTPIILIPVRLYYENDMIYFQMINKPIVNPHVFGEMGKSYDSTEKLDSIQNMDKFITTFLNNHTHNVKYENYMTVMNFSQPEINLRHDKYKLDTSLGSNLIDTYSISYDRDYYNITPLDRTQRTILAMASRGNSFAISGYEGTGKTTTLINIAADAIKNGKRVLYISNNDSTLSNVYSVFKEYDLHSFVSNLSNSFSKVNEKPTEVKRVQIYEGMIKESLRDNYFEIESLCNQYASKIKNHLLIEIMKELIITPKPNELFDEKIMKNSYCLFRHEIDEVLDALDIIEKEMVKMPSFINSHFINIPISHNIKDFNEPLALLEQIYVNYCILKETKDILERNFGFSNITDYALFINRIKTYEKINKTTVPLSWLTIDDSQPDIRSKFKNFARAKELYEFFKEEIIAHDEIEKIISDTYTDHITNFDVKNAINLVEGSFFKGNKQGIDNVLRDFKTINNKLDESLDYCDDYETHFAKLKSRLGFTVDITNTKVINQIIDFLFVLDKGYFAKVWCDYDNKDGIYRKMVNIENTLDKYEESLKIYYKYFDNLNTIDTYINVLKRKNRDENSKYKKVPVKELLDCLSFIKEHKDKVDTLRKDYKELTYAEHKYKVHVSDIYKEFIDKHDLIDNKNSRIQIEKSFQDLRGSGIVDVLTLAKEYKQIESKIISGYEFFEKYTLVNNSESLVDKINQIRSIKKYIKNVVKCQDDMKNILRESKEQILFKDYKTLLDNLNTRKQINDKINSNDEYRFLYEDLFKGEETNIDEIELCISDFNSYVDIFKNPQCLIKSFEPVYNGQIVIHLNNASKTIREINELFKGYVKIFKTNISKFYYESFKKIINYFKELIESKEELKTYLYIADQMKVLLKYKLFNLNNFIIHNNHELVKERFKYSYFIHLYEEFKLSNKSFDNIKEYEATLDAVLADEKLLLENNALIVRSSKRNSNGGKARYLNYNSFIEKNKNNKMLFLADTQIANQYLNMDLFDIALIDDAQLLNANEYYKVISVKQVIVSGTEQLQTPLNDNLMSRIRPSNLMKLRYKYKKTPLLLLSQFEGINGRFYSDVSLNKGIVITGEDYNSVLVNLYKENPNYQINFFTSSLNIIHDTIKNIGSVLYDKNLSVYEIYLFFKYNLNVSDLSNGYLLDSDYNVLYLDSYNDINNEFVAINMIKNLLSCGKKLIIVDNKNHLNDEKPCLFIEKLNEAINYSLQKPILQENTVLLNVSKALSKYQIKTRKVSLPQHLIVEYDNKYFGIMLFENPGNTEFTMLNEYREFKSSDFPTIIVWLPNLVEDFNKTITKIVKEIKS